MNANPDILFDAVIVGGGPAGLTAGLALTEHYDSTTRRPPRVLILERRTGVLDKTCGEGIMPTGRAFLARLGLTEFRNPPAGFGHLFHGIEYISRRGRTAAADFAEGPGLGLARTELSRALLDLASERPGIEFRRDAFRALRREDDRLWITTATGAKIATRLLIGADGLHSRVRREAGLANDTPTDRDAGRWGVRRHFRLRPWSRRVQVYWTRGAEAYVTPVGTDRVGVAVLWSPGRLEIRGGQRTFDDLLRLFPELRERLAGAGTLDAPRAVGPLRQKTKGSIDDGVLLLGDAAGYLDAATGEGLSLAFAQALALSEHVEPLLRREEPGLLARDSLRAFEREQKRITTPYYRMTSAVLLLHRFPFLQEPVTAVLARFPRLFRFLLSLNMGVRHVARNSKQMPGIHPPADWHASGKQFGH